MEGFLSRSWFVVFRHYDENLSTGETSVVGVPTNRSAEVMTLLPQRWRIRRGASWVDVGTRTLIFDVDVGTVVLLDGEYAEAWRQLRVGCPIKVVSERLKVHCQLDDHRVKVTIGVLVRRLKKAGVIEASETDR